MKKITIASYLLIILVLAAATVVEKFEGSDTAYTMIYSSLWFKILWGVLVAGALLVSHLSFMSPEMTPLMPVLQSPLLSIHVSTIMVAYALFAILTLVSVAALIAYRRGGAQAEHMTLVCELLLYPAVFLLTTGIFLGAVWANVSWGTYWSWDPKETWALITLMVYAAPLHRHSVRMFSEPRKYHIYIICAFVSVLVTYFGVNYLLGGMHSYA